MTTTGPMSNASRRFISFLAAPGVSPLIALMHDQVGALEEAGVHAAFLNSTLDGEAAPAGGMGIAKQLKDEIFQCPPVLLLTGRPQDAWLATWSRAEAAVSHPIDPVLLAETVVGLLRDRVPATRG